MQNAGLWDRADTDPADKMDMADQVGLTAPALALAPDLDPAAPAA